MPDRGIHATSGKANLRPDRKNRVKPDQTLDARHVAGQKGVSSLPESLLPGDFGDRTFESHAELLGDPKMSHAMYAEERARIVLQLQRDYGNRYVQRLVTHISQKRAEEVQTKLKVGPAGDKYEQEADRTAKTVMQTMSSPAPEAAQRQEEEEELQMKPLLQRQEEEEELQMKPLAQRQEEEEELQMKPLAQRQEEEEELQMKPLAQRQEEEEELQMKPLAQRQEEEEELQMKPLLQRQDDEEELQMKPLLQRRVGLEGGDVSPEVERSIQQTQGRGKPLPDSLRTSMEGAFGTDFSGVRVHDDAEADTLNNSIQARAFTTGKDIYLGQGEYNPGSSSGQELLAHELTHVVQQNGVTDVRKSEATEHDMPRPAVMDPEAVQRVVLKRRLPKPPNRPLPTPSPSKEPQSGATGPSRGDQAMVALKDALMEESKKATFTKWVTSLYKPINSIIGSIKAAAKSSAVEDLTKAVSGVSGSISKGISIVPAVAGIFTTAISGISAYMGRFKEIKTLQKLKKTHEDTERKGEFAQAVAYGAKKAVRGAWIAMLKLAVSVVQAIVSALAAIAGFVGLFVPWIAIVAAALTGLAAVIGLVKMAGGVGRKMKGIYKFVKGTRGKNRAKNAGIIVDTARGKDEGESRGVSEREQAVTLIKDLKPDGLLGLLTANVKDVQKALNGASEKDIENLKKGMAKKLKSS